MKYIYVKWKNIDKNVKGTDWCNKTVIEKGAVQKDVKGNNEKVQMKTKGQAKKYEETDVLWY